MAFQNLLRQPPVLELIISEILNLEDSPFFENVLHFM